ncbi:hypothetical protein GSI_14108 [Ganoderma sinense ZZ0214-1]|uniref:polynucleotide adenylyltransferase n=1 Tax=Ganoderma sinense ZZ0214-1 TaxID=1077348 RepID=A0A2G8RS61_9APHY|nr:hypothetical protein GSI_14108 [Ganoderma sinense ZZ0214-1]
MSNKDHSQRSSVSAPDENSSSNRRARRKGKQRQNAEAGPSDTQHACSSKPPGGAAEGSKLATRNAVNGDGRDSFGNDDFIAFSLSDAEEADKQSARASSPPVREWDRGKAKAKEREEHAGRKRKVEEVDFNDGYANKKQRVAAASRRAPWAQDVDWDKCANVAEMLHDEVGAFVKYMSPTPVEDEVRSLSVMLIANAIRKTYSDAEVLPFGSYDTKLYLPQGDIDLVIYSRSMMRMAKSSVLHSLANIVKKAGITDRVTIIAKAKVPIIKFVTTHGRFSVDISINQGNGVDAGKMVKQFLRELPALQSLVLIIKSFLSQRSMNEVFTGGLGSYSIVCLAISFLQMHPKVRRGEIDPSKNLGVLVMEFFELYGSYFNYQEVGISLRNGGSYFNKREKGWFDYREPRLLSIEDPGDPANDISRGSYNFARVRTTLAGAFGIMTAAAYAQASIVTARRTGRAVRLRPMTDPEEMSILSSVMGVTQETINHRRVVQEVYDRQILHRMLGLVPQPPLSTQDATSGRASRTVEAESVEDAHAWGEADMDTSDDSESEAQAMAESRYDIDNRKQPPKKRRRTGTRADEDITQTVYTTDEEEDGYLATHQPHDSADGITEEEEEYAVSAVDGTDQERGGGKAEKRSYWLSKGMAGGSADSDD